MDFKIVILPIFGSITSLNQIELGLIGLQFWLYWPEKRGGTHMGGPFAFQGGPKAMS